jgi:hypothetical protein
VTTVTKCFSGFTAKCVVDFYLDWLNELVDRSDYEGEGVFGNVVAGLYRLADARSIPFIADGLRPAGQAMALPCGSASTRSTRLPALASTAAMLTALQESPESANNRPSPGDNGNCR